MRRLPALAARLRGRVVEVAGAVDIAYFLEATSATVAVRTTSRWSRARSRRWTTRTGSRRLRRKSRALTTIGACATSVKSGTPQLRGRERLRSDRLRVAGVHLDACNIMGIADHVAVDFELRGRPIDKRQLLEVVTAFLHGRRPNVPGYSGADGASASGGGMPRRHRRDGTPCPRPGHAGRLRPAGSAPRTRAAATAAWADGDAEHGLVLEAPARAGGDHLLARPRLPHVQRERARVQGGEHSRWSA